MKLFWSALPNGCAIKYGNFNWRALQLYFIAKCTGACASGVTRANVFYKDGQEVSCVFARYIFFEIRNVYLYFRLSTLRAHYNTERKRNTSIKNPQPLIHENLDNVINAR